MSSGPKSLKTREEQYCFLMQGDAACFKRINLIRALGPPVFPGLVELGGCLVLHRIQCLSLCNL